MTKRLHASNWCKALMAPALLFGWTGGVQAQTATAPNIGNYQSLADLFRIGIAIGGPAPVNDSFGLQVAEDAEDFLRPDQLLARYGNRYNNQAAVTGVLDFRGVEMIGSYQPNSPIFTLRVPAFDENGQPFLLTFNGATRQESYNQFTDYFDEIEGDEAERLIRLLLKALARSSPLDPLAGNPNSVQGTLVRSALDLSSGDSAIETGTSGTNTPGDPWIVGATYNHSTSGRFSSSRYDARVQRSFRMMEGGRALLKFDMPVSYSEVNGARAATAQLGVGLEWPLIEGRWSVEPRLGYGITASDELGSLGHMLSATVASRFVINNLGRGRLVIGNMGGYTTTLSTAFTGYNIDPGIQNWVTRNGVAYELPLKMRAGGRTTSIRGSYSYTKYFGDEIYSDQFHEATLSLGVRGREESLRNRWDVIRFNLSAIRTKGYKSYSAGIGFRF